LAFAAQQANEMTPFLVMESVFLGFNQKKKW